MSVISVDTRDRKPIYEQLTDNIKNLVLRGILSPDEQLPGVRTLAVELAINPNTIQKAYAELERQGIIYSIQGRGSFVTNNVERLRALERENILSEIEKAFLGAKQAGLDKADITTLADKIWRDNN